VRRSDTVLLVSHEATRTGAPRIAVQLARAIEACGRRVTTLLRWDGPLRDDMRSASTRLVLEPLRRTRGLVRKLYPSATFTSRLEEAEACVTLLWLRPGVVYANTVKSASYVRPARRLGIPVVLHVHEVGALASRTLARYRLAGHYAHIHLVACSEAAADDLAELTGEPRGRIAVVPSLVDASRVVMLAGAAPPAIRDDAGATIVVGACGVANERKGIDLWLRMIRTVQGTEHGRDLRFVWVGDHDQSALDAAAELGVEGLVEFTGELENPLPTVARFDIFTLSSRADPFPLAVLEAMALARPVVAFAVDGVPEQVGDAGVLVPAEDVDALARAVVSLASDPDRRSELAHAAAARAAGALGIDRFDEAVCDVVHRVGVG
jgi:glycosyltransferase involved in cell wall biosynthesis